jgi:hypothetical protein
MGFCISTCDMFVAGECAAVDGQERYCHPGFAAGTPAQQLEGQCLDQATTTVAAGEPCDPEFDGGVTANVCVDGAICLDLSDDATENPTCVAFCDCEAGFDATTDECTGASTQCAETEVCVDIPQQAGEPQNTRIGFCLEQVTTP